MIQNVSLNVIDFVSRYSLRWFVIRGGWR